MVGGSGGDRRVGGREEEEEAEVDEVEEVAKS